MNLKINLKETKMNTDKNKTLPTFKEMEKLATTIINNWEDQTIKDYAIDQLVEEYKNNYEVFNEDYMNHRDLIIINERELN